LCIPVTSRVEKYTRFAGEYVTGKGERVRHAPKKKETEDHLASVARH